MIKKIRYFFVLLLIVSNILAQSTSSFLKDAEKKKELKKYEEAIELYSKVIALKPANRDALEGRSYCYLQVKNYEKAVDDYKFLVNIKPHNNEYILGLADSYLLAGKIKSSIEYYQRALSEDNNNLICYEKLIIALIKSKEYENAQLYCNDAMSKSFENPKFFFLKAVALDSSRNYQNATMSYERAIKMIEADEKYKKLSNKSEYKRYYSNLARDYQILFRYEDSEKYYKAAVNLDKTDYENYISLGKIYFLKNDFNKAIEKYNEALAISSNNPEIYLHRALSYKKLKQFFTAIQDLDFVIQLDPKNDKAYIEKAKCYEDMEQFKNALDAYNLAKEVNPDNLEILRLIKQLSIKEYEINREADKPIIQITAPATSETEGLIIPVSRNFIEFKGKIIDKSRISKVYIDDIEAKFDVDKLDPVFFATVSVENKTSVTIKAIDVYNNTQKATFNLNRFESTPPNIELTEPLATSNYEIYTGNNSVKKIKIEGIVNDESFIKSLSLNGMVLSISLSENNPKFTAEIDVSLTDSLIFEATDFFGNSSTTKYTINRKAAKESSINPMGITWVIFIANSNYVNFTSLDGPNKDKEKFKSALANYRIDRFIEKNDLTKEEMEKFFAIELRNLLKSTQVNSLLIWFAGHGKYLNDNGYWIPVNANKGEEYSYFQITNLKGYVSTYKLLKHVLVISDACETGPAFCTSEINETDPGSCEKSQAINLVSSQVFTSSNSEQSSDISLFAESFCSSLRNNTSKCISIEKIKNTVINIVTSNQKQKPKFGLITGLENKGGSFYFMKK